MDALSPDVVALLQTGSAPALAIYVIWRLESRLGRIEKAFDMLISHFLSKAEKS